MTVEHIVVGPPGCGKTDWIGKQVVRAVEHYGPDRVMVTSLTRAAAREAAGRTDLPRRLCGTLHSICYHALGQPKVIDSKAITEWNDEHPSWKLSGAEREDSIDEPAREGAGDRLLELVERARHTLTPVPPRAVAFASAWEDFKRHTERVDFTDMIERALHEVPIPPGGPSFLLNDEYQDDSNLELALLRRWSMHVEHFALVGDPAQSIYAWRHASKDTAAAVPTIPLRQSYRVPRTVQEAAVSLIRRSSTYQEVEYRPRRTEGDVGEIVEGEVAQLDCSYAEAERLLEALRRLDGSVMVLASCAYMLHPLLALLRRNGVPYCNPYRADSTWNPLAGGTDKRRTAIDRLESWATSASFLAGDGAPPAAWHLTLLAKTLLRSGARAEAKGIFEELPSEPNVPQLVTAMRSAFTEEAILAMMAGDYHWMLAHSRSEVKRGLAYPLKVLEERGLDGLLGKPQIMVGTIHSVKGGQADHVVLAPDLSTRGMADFRQPGWSHRDGVIRMFYVGMTRARQSLRVLRPNGWSVDLLRGGS